MKANAGILLALVLFVATFSAHAEEVAAPPELRPGDRWIVEGTDLLKNEVRWKVRREITKVDGNIATWKYEQLPPSGPATGETRFDIAAQVQQRPGLLSGKPEITSFPLSPGKEWKYEYERKGGYGTVRYEMNAKVKDWEEVTVAAGKFRCLRIEHDGYWSREANFAVDGRSSGTVKGRFRATYWYAPAAKAIAKSVTDEYSGAGNIWGQFQEQLVEVALSAQ